jgi:unsaturated rhamnogalacturonyl hydrolase
MTGKGREPVGGLAMRARPGLFGYLAVLVAPIVVAAETFDVGLAASGARLDGQFVAADNSDAPTVLLIGGLHGTDASVAAVGNAVAAFEQERPSHRRVNLLAIPLANPDGAPLEFPSTGAAYRENIESNVLWRWIGAHAPDLVLIAGDDSAGLAAALAANAAAGVGRVPSRAWLGTPIGRLRADEVGVSEAHREIERRLARTPRQLATELGEVYGHDFDQPIYINAIALMAQLKLGNLADVQRLVEPYVSGAKNSLERPNSLTMAGHIVFTELARKTGDARYVAMVRKVADLGFDERGQMRESMPYHNEFSDSIFMGTAIVAQAGTLTGERKYFDMAARHLEFMQRIDLRPDGLYRHQPATDAAWGRGNAFAALGLALTLSDLPEYHPAYAGVLRSYREHMAQLLRYQDRDGLWRNVIDYPGAYAEFSATAMIGFAMERGLRNGWLENADVYRAAVARAWRAVDARTGPGGTMIDVCESTARIESLEGYLRREAILGRDARGGAMAMLFATELMD